MPFCATRKTNPLYHAFRASITQLYDYVAPPSKQDGAISPIEVNEDNIHVKVNRAPETYMLDAANYNFRKRMPINYKA